MPDDHEDNPFPDADMADPVHRSMVEMYAAGDPHMRKYLRDCNKRVQINAARGRQWVLQFERLARIIDEQGSAAPWHVVELFWIRLYGALTEVHDNFAQMAKWAPEVPSNPALQTAARIHNATTMLRKCFTDEELVFIEYMRSNAAHVRLKGYEVRWEPKGQLSHDGKEIKLIGKRLSTAESDRIVEEAFARVKGDPRPIASSFVQRLKPSIIELEEAMAEWA